MIDDVIAPSYQVLPSKQMMNDLDKEMSEYLDVNQITNQLENAFEGKNI